MVTAGQGDYALVAVPEPRSLNELASIYSADSPVTVPFAPSADLCPRLCFFFSGLKGFDNWPQDDWPIGARQMTFRIGRWGLSCLNFVFLESKLGEVRPGGLSPVTGRLSLF